MLGLKVLDFSRGMAGALATMLLADYGADVTKVVSPEGDPLGHAPAFRVWNRGKKSLALDLKRPRDRVKAHELCQDRDVVLETFRPGVAERLGIGHSELRGLNPCLVYCSISSYGQQGPWKDRHGYEGLVAAASGIMTEQNGPRGGPMFCSIPLASLGASLLALQGILAATYTRDITGKGQYVSTSLYQGAIAIRQPMLPRAHGLPELHLNNIEPQGGLPAYRMYPCGDGRWLHIGCLKREFWDKLAIGLDLLLLATDPRFSAAPTGWERDEDRLLAIELIGQRLKEGPRADWLQRLEEADVPTAPVMTTQEFMDIPQVRQSGSVAKVKDQVLGNTEQMAPVIGFSPSPADERQSETAPATPSETATLSPSGEENPEHAARPPLDGVRVLDLSAFIAGPLGPMVLSDLGADVVKIEPLNGEGVRTLPFLFLGVNRGKRDVALDIKSLAGREVLERLIRRSDVVVHNMRVGVAERLGIDYESVKRLQPHVIYVHSTGYGSTGPEAHKPGVDPLFQSLSGITSRQGAGTGRPVFLKTPVCDDANGHLLAVAVLMGLRHRQCTGEGGKLELSLLGTSILVNSDDFLRYDGKKPRPLADQDLYGMSALYRLYNTAQGWIFLSCVQEKEWAALVEILGTSINSEDMTFEAASAMDPWNDELCAALAAEFARRPAAEWEQLLTGHGIPCVRVAEDNQEGFYHNPQALSLSAVSHKHHAEYPDLRQPGTMIEFSETPMADKPAAPLLGQHTQEILEELGYSPQRISELIADGAVATV